MNSGIKWAMKEQRIRLRPKRHQSAKKKLEEEDEGEQESDRTAEYDEEEEKKEEEDEEKKEPEKATAISDKKVEADMKNKSEKKL